MFTISVSDMNQLVNRLNVKYLKIYLHCFEHGVSLCFFFNLLWAYFILEE